MIVGLDTFVSTYFSGGIDDFPIHQINNATLESPRRLREVRNTKLRPTLCALQYSHSWLVKQVEEWRKEEIVAARLRSCLDVDDGVC